MGMRLIGMWIFCYDMENHVITPTEKNSEMLNKNSTFFFRWRLTEIPLIRLVVMDGNCMTVFVNLMTTAMKLMSISAGDHCKQQ